MVNVCRTIDKHKTKVMLYYLGTRPRHTSGKDLLEKGYTEIGLVGTNRRHVIREKL